MRTAVLIVHKEGSSVPELTYGRADQIRELYKHAKLEGIAGASSCEVWESDRGRVRRRKFSAGVPDEATAEDIVSDPEPVKRGPGRPKKITT